MTYYSGDYMGSYGRGRMQGDPGIFSFLGGLAKKAVGFIPGVGPAISAGLSMIPKGSKTAMVKAAGSKALTVIKKHPGMTAAAGAGILAGGAGVAMAAHHPGARAMGVGGRHKRMRVTNPKALRRAIRRTQGFAKLAMRTIHLVHPKKKGRFGGFRKRTRKAA